MARLSLRDAAARCITPALVLLAWEFLARSGAVTNFMLPPLSAVLERIWHDATAGDLLFNVAVTLFRALAGFAIAAVLGVGLAMLIARSAVARWFFDPVISVGFPMPKIAFLPVVILWFGVYDLSKLTMVVVDAIFPVVSATVAGIAAVEKELLWSARSLGASERRLWGEVTLTAALPQVMTGLQVALPIAIIVAVFTEMVMGGYGLGAVMIGASRFADSRGVFRGNRGDHGRRLRRGQGDGAAAGAAAGVAPGVGGAVNSSPLPL